MMGHYSSFCILLSLTNAVLGNIGIPVIGYQNVGGRMTVPKAVVGHTIPAKDFTGIMTEAMKDRPSLFIIFIQDQLSTEDFLRVDSKMTPGGVFRHLQAYSKSNGAFYMPSVKSPYPALKELITPYHTNVELKNDVDAIKYITGASVEKDTSVIIHLQSTMDGENLSKSLQANDEIIGKVTEHLETLGLSYVALYTASSHRRSHEAVSQSSGRHLLAVDDAAAPSSDGVFYKNDACLVFVTNFTIDGSDVESQGIKCERANTSDTGTNGTFVKVTFSSAGAKSVFTFEEKNRVWSLDSISINNITVNKTDMPYIRAPVGFSYHCLGKLNVSTSANDSKGFLTVQRYQFQMFSNTSSGRFANSYDCSGFFTIPIWTGLLLALLLISITVFGIGMLHNITTFDQFDDPRGKPLIINASE